MLASLGGNVGIGTTSPVEKLQVGAIDTDNSIYLASKATYLQAALTNRSSLIIGNSNQYAVADGEVWRWRIGNMADGPYGSDFAIRRSIRSGVDNTINDIVDFVINKSGNVGIGTTNPGASLDIKKNASALVEGLTIQNRQHDSTGNPAVRLKLQLGDPTEAYKWGGMDYVAGGWEEGGALQFRVQSPGDTTNPPAVRMTVQGAGGNVGIGTAGPLSKLDVNGGVAVGSYAGANAAPSNGMIISGNVGIGAASPAGTLEVDSNGRQSFVSRAISGYTSTRDGLGPDYILLHKAHNTVLMPDYYVMGKITGIRGGTTSWNRKWTAEINTATAYDSTRGSIVTYNEGARLVTLYYNSVKYLAVETATNSSMSGLIFTGVATAADGELLRLVYGTEVTGVVDFATSDNVTFANSNVGIGTTSPLRNLHINAAAAEASLILSRADGLANNKNWRIFTNSSGAGQAPDMYIDILNDAGDAARNVMTFLNSGNVGIGTTSPGAKLEVNGTILANGIFPDYTNGISQAYNTAYQAASNGYLNVVFSGSYMNGLRIFVGNTSSPSTTVWEDGDDINNNTKSGSALIPMKKGTWYKVVQGPYGYAYETINITFYPAD